MKGKVEKEWTGLGHLADGSNRFLRVTFGQRRQVGWLLDDLIISEERTTDVIVVTSADARFLNIIIIDLIGLILKLSKMLKKSLRIRLKLHCIVWKRVKLNLSSKTQ